LAAARDVGLLPLGLEPSDHDLQHLRAELEQHLPGTVVRVEADLLGTRACSHQLLVTRAGATERSNLQTLRQQLQLQDQPITGWLLLASSVDG
jgi:hypothetical protein